MDVKEREKISEKSKVYADFPCFTEKKLVDECYNKTRYNMEACAAPISNYKTCKNFWTVVEKLRKFQRVYPTKPTAEERERIKEYYVRHKKLPPFPLEADPPE